jgi:exportin-2 (importin alpha re-exporter)
LHVTALATALTRLISQTKAEKLTRRVELSLLQSRSTYSRSIYVRKMVRAPQSTVDVRIREPRAESRHFFGSRSRSKLELAGPARRTLPSKSLVCLQRVWFSPPEHLNWTEQLKLLTPGTPKTLALGMECSQQNIEAMAAMLGQTLNPDATARKAAEDFLAQNSGVPGFGLVLLQLLTMDSAPAHIRQAGAVTFKNYVKKGWQAPEDGDAPAGQLIPDGDRAQIKTNIVSLMLSVPTQVQKQLGEGLSLIASHDFPAKWQNLLPELIAQLGSSNPAAIDGVLQSVNSVCKRFRAAMKTDEAMEQFKYVLDTFQDAHLQIFTALVDQLPQKNAPGADAEGLKLTMSSIRVCLRIFLSLNSLDIPEFYEDHMDDWFGRFQGFLATDFACPAIAGDASDGRPSLVEQVQAAVCENLELYMQKYEEEFGKYLPTFVPLVWQLLVAKGSEARYDILVTTCIKFLTSVSMSVHHSVFENPATLEQICTHIVIPNIKFREEDEELFEDNPQEYIRQDIEGSDTDTRRRTACELVKGLRKYYEGPCTQIFGKHVTELLAQHAANPRANWQAKDAAVYIVTSLAVKTSTARDGTTSTNELVNIVDFFQTNILPELQSADAAHPILTADAIKFATTFRLQLPKASYGAIISALAPYLGNAACPAVTVSYIAHCLERLLTVRDQAPGGSKVGRVTKEEMAPALESLLGGFFGALDRDDMKENEYVMKAVMRLISFGKELLLPHVSLCMEKVSETQMAPVSPPAYLCLLSLSHLGMV